MNKIKENLKEIAKILNCDEKKLIDEIKTVIENSNEEMLLNFIQDEVIDNSLKTKQLQHFENQNKDDIFLYDDVKKAVLSFEDKIKDLTYSRDMEQRWLKQFREDFGDW